MKRTKELRLTLMAVMPVMLAACSDTDGGFYSSYSRTAYASLQECQLAYPNIDDACFYDDDDDDGRFHYYGPFSKKHKNKWVYLPYTKTGGVSTRGYAYDPSTRSYSMFNEPAAARAVASSSARRGGFGTRSSSSSSFGG